ncbi:NmrA family NAD(P)-binding protein [Photobacterium sp. BZF1]|uniref:NmrA family NAD(P)-binding protein n=1 Tax=Photobacterium sp. BZF1 TaxID=1904457 RepID=UPI001653B9FF|nr:NmrA family NAD(P)-binding protein [Photobacterium sp. BZF1]MBC7003021.1 NmrA family NAD(P)-binding protein [Photobacterium sp. BZF1]
MTTLLFAGATGNIAKRAIKNLQNANVTIKAGIREAELEVGRAHFASQQNVDVVELDLLKPETFKPAFEGVDIVYFATLLAVPGEFEKAYIEAAQAAGTVKHIIHSTGSTADVPEVFKLCSEFIFEREALTRESGINYTFLRPLMFMENFATMLAPSIRNEDGWSEPLIGSAEVAYVDVQDIANVVSSIALSPTAHEGKTYTLSGPDAISSDVIAELLSEALDRKITYTEMSAEDWSSANWGGVEVADSNNWLFNILRENYQGFALGAEGKNLLNDNIKNITGKEPTSFRAFIARSVNVWKK